MTSDLPVSPLLLYRHCFSSLCFIAIFFWITFFFSKSQNSISILLLEMQQNVVPQLLAAYDEQEKKWKESRRISLGKPRKLFVTLSLTALITCIWQPQWVPTEGTPGHPTLTLWDWKPPCNNPIFQLGKKVLETGKPQGQICNCWVISQSLRQCSYAPGIRRKEKRWIVFFLH